MLQNRSKSSSYLPIILFITTVISQIYATHGTQPRNDPCFYTPTKPIRDVVGCVAQIKLAAIDTKSWWFGDQWHLSCGERRADSVSCFNPAPLRPFRSLGARLLRTSTFDPAYLRNLRVVPEAVFQSIPGSYTACDHTFTPVSNTSTKPLSSVLHSAAPPTDGWHLRARPSIAWTEFDAAKKQTAYYTVLAVDVALGTLHHLMFNFPHATKEPYQYTGPINFRQHKPNPLAIVVFEQPAGRVDNVQWRQSIDENDLFQIQRFMIDNGFEDSFIGLNWVSVAGDPYGMERHRVINKIDNCPALLKEKIFSRIDGVKIPYLPQPSLHALSHWVTVTYQSSEVAFTLCCDTLHYPPRVTRVDPLAQGQNEGISMAHLLEPPVFMASVEGDGILAQGKGYTVDRRSSRDFVVLMDQLYTILIIGESTTPLPGSKPFAHYLVMNVPLAALSDGLKPGSAGRTMLAYMPPSRGDGRLVYVLLEQKEGPIYDYKADWFSDRGACETEMIGRCSYSVEGLMARYALKLHAISWHSVLGPSSDAYAAFQMVNSGTASERDVCRRRGTAVALQQASSGQCPPAAILAAATYTGLFQNGAGRLPGVGGCLGVMLALVYALLECVRWGV